MDNYQKEFLLSLCEALIEHTGTKEAILILRQKDSHRLQVILVPDDLKDEHLKAIEKKVMRYIEQHSDPSDQKVSLKSRDGETFFP